MSTFVSVSQPAPFSLDLHSMLSQDQDKELNRLLDLTKLQINSEPCKRNLHEFFTTHSPSLFRPLHLDLDLPKLKLSPMPLLLFQSHDTLLITRPLKEFFSHIWNFKIPSLELIARVIKTLALSIFRWHLCDRVLLIQKSDLLIEGKVVFQFSSDVSEMKDADFELAYPYLLENAYKLNPKQKKLEEHDFDYDRLSPDTLRAYFKKCYQIRITAKKNGNTIYDLFQSQELVLEKFKIE